MFKINPKKILLKIPSIYDYQPPIPIEVRKQVIQRVMLNHPNLQIKGGDSQTNPYKIPYELVLADRIEQFEKYKKSILWSPRYTPWHFKVTFFYPAIFVAILMWYIRYVAMPQRIIYLRNKYGYKCQDLVDRGWIDGWEEEDDEIQSRDEILGFDQASMSFQDLTQIKLKEQKYTDFTLQDLQNFENKVVYIDQNPQQKTQEQSTGSSNPQMKNYKNKMQSRLEKIYAIKEQTK